LTADDQIHKKGWKEWRFASDVQFLKLKPISSTPSPKPTKHKGSQPTYSKSHSSSIDDGRLSPSTSPSLTPVTDRQSESSKRAKNEPATVKEQNKRKRRPKKNKKKKTKQKMRKTKKKKSHHSSEESSSSSADVEHSYEHSSESSSECGSESSSSYESVRPRKKRRKKTKKTTKKKRSRSILAKYQCARMRIQQLENDKYAKFYE
jgi:hypothetical protein